MLFVSWVIKATGTHSALLFYHDNNGYAKAPQGYVIRTFPVLLYSAPLRTRNLMYQGRNLYHAHSNKMKVLSYIILVSFILRCSYVSLYDADGRMTDKLSFRKDLEGIGCCLFVVVSQNATRETEGCH